MATVGGKTLTALDLSRYRYSCVLIIQLTELTVLGRNIAVTLFESDFEPSSTQDPSSCVGSDLCTPCPPRQAGLAQPRAVMCLEASGLKVHFIPSPLLTSLEKAWGPLKLLEPNTTKENFPSSVNRWSPWLKIPLMLLIPSTSHLCSQPFLV